MSIYLSLYVDRYIDHSMVIARGKGCVGRRRWAKEGKMGMEGNVAWGDGCTMDCVDDVLLSCTLEPCMVLQINVPLKTNKKIK